MYLNCHALSSLRYTKLYRASTALCHRRLDNLGSHWSGIAPVFRPTEAGTLTSVTPPPLDGESLYASAAVR